jgi:hypothetical protein
MPKQHAGTMEYGGCGDGKTTEGSRKENTWGEVAVWQTLRGQGRAHQSIICVEIIKLSLHKLYHPHSAQPSPKKKQESHTYVQYNVHDIQNTGTRPTLTIDE